jgi:phage/conjugal plasmid C-4 type zinc finger TraR family protein
MTPDEADQADKAQELADRDRDARVKAIMAREALPPPEDNGARICVGCEQPIPLARVKVSPHAKRCMPCQQEHEMGKW